MSILMPDIAIMETILRSVVVYPFRLVSFRLADKRLLGQLTAFERTCPPSSSVTATSCRRISTTST
jgi:hypothetical protein